MCSSLGHVMPGITKAPTGSGNLEGLKMYPKPRFITQDPATCIFIFKNKQVALGMLHYFEDNNAILYNVGSTESLYFKKTCMSVCKYV